MVTSPDTMSRPCRSSTNSVARSRAPNPFDELRRAQDRAGHPNRLHNNHLRRCLPADTPRLVCRSRTVAAVERALLPIVSGVSTDKHAHSR